MASPCWRAAIAISRAVWRSIISPAPSTSWMMDFSIFSCTGTSIWWRSPGRTWTARGRCRPAGCANRSTRLPTPTPSSRSTSEPSGLTVACRSGARHGSSERRAWRSPWPRRSRSTRRPLSRWPASPGPAGSFRIFARRAGRSRASWRLAIITRTRDETSSGSLVSRDSNARISWSRRRRIAIRN